MKAEECEEEDGDGLREVGGEGVEAEEAEADGYEPVGERGFFEIADAVDVEGGPVAGEGDVAGGLCVGGVGVVEQGRCEESGAEEDGPESAEEENRTLGAGVGGVLGGCCDGGGLSGHAAIVLI